MKKAKFIHKYYGTGYDRGKNIIEYEYRGHTYWVDENLNQGNEPFAWQHRNAQARIDTLIEREEQDKKRREKEVKLSPEERYKLTADYALDEFFKFINDEPSIYEKEEGDADSKK
jgi:hypothetical protein